MNFEKLRKEQIKFYTNLLKEDEILLLVSSDEYYKNHFMGSPLNVLTNFSGSEGECTIDKNGKITIFVDTRYHILVDKQVYDDVEIVKMPLGETFLESFKKRYKKNTIMHLPDTIELEKYLNFDKYFDTRKYSPLEKYIKNYDINENNKIFLVDEKIEKHGFEYKINKFKNLNPDCKRVLIFNLDYISYLTNLRSYKMKYSSNFKSILYLDFEKREHILFIDENDIKIKGLKVLPIKKYFEFVNQIEDKIYIDYKDVSLNKFLTIKNPIQIKTNSLAIISSIKPKSVIEHLFSAFNKTDIAIYNFKNQIKEGMNEKELVEIFERELLKTGAFMASFKTILSIDENTASIHYSSYDKNKILKPESILLLDCGGYFEGGFATDITRTFYFGKNPKPVFKKVYTLVLKAFIECYLSKSTDAKELDLMAREILKPMFNDGFNFDHGLGHGIGTSVHQNPPRLSNVSNDTIKPFQVHSIEPGLYGKSKSENVEFGVRIENCVYSDINYNKITLSKFPFEEVLIDYNLLSINELNLVQKWQKDFKI